MSRERKLSSDKKNGEWMQACHLLEKKIRVLGNPILTSKECLLLCKDFTEADLLALNDFFEVLLRLRAIVDISEADIDSARANQVLTDTTRKLLTRMIKRRPDLRFLFQAAVEDFSEKLAKLNAYLETPVEPFKGFTYSHDATPTSIAEDAKEKLVTESTKKIEEYFILLCKRKPHVYQTEQASHGMRQCKKFLETLEQEQHMELARFFTTFDQLLKGAYQKTGYSYVEAFTCTTPIRMIQKHLDETHAFFKAYLEDCIDYFFECVSILNPDRTEERIPPFYFTQRIQPSPEHPRVGIAQVPKHILEEIRHEIAGTIEPDQAIRVSLTIGSSTWPASLNINPQRGESQLFIPVSILVKERIVPNDLVRFTLKVG